MTRKKLRELGISIGKMRAGTKNCITDVPGVRVGHETLYYALQNDEYVSTGVTAVLPHGGNLFRHKVAAAGYVLNGFGKTTGLVQLYELGRLESPIMLTNTFGVPAITQGTLEYLLKQSPEIGDTTGTINVVVGECNDSYLNAIRTFPMQPEHAREAIRKATSNRVEEGVVGAGTGMVCFDYKGGIGCSSRLIQDDIEDETYVIGCLVLSNFGKQEDLLQHKIFSHQGQQVDEQFNVASDGSIMIVLATNAPLNERQLKRIAKRAGVGLGKAGSHIAHGSGDIVIAFSTAQTFPHHSNETKEKVVQLLDDRATMNELFIGAAEVTEEAIFNSLTMATTTRGRKGRQVHELPYDLFLDGALKDERNTR